MSHYIMKYPDGKYVERDDSSGPMSSGGYPFPTDDPWRATRWPTRVEALRYAKHDFGKGWTLHEIGVDVGPALTVSPRELAEASGDKEYEEYVRLSKKFGMESTTCPFDKAWVGKCGKETPPGELYCKDHLGEKCWSCGGQATADCSFAGQFVCGQPMCAEHDHYSRHRTY